MRLYKVLQRNNDNLLTSPFQNYVYTPQKTYICKDFDESKNVACSKGYYATDIDGLSYAFRNLPGYEVWQVKVGGKCVEYDPFKRRYERITILEQIPNKKIKELALAEEDKVGYKLAEVLFPVNPLKIEAGEVSEEEIVLLKQWASVRDLVVASFGDSVKDSVEVLVRDSVWDSVVGSLMPSVWNTVVDSLSALVKDSVSDSIGDLIMAYISSLFPNIKKWKYIEHTEGINPFQCAIDLWHKGFVPSYDGNVWRLHAGENAKVVWEGELSGEEY